MPIEDNKYVGKIHQIISAATKAAGGRCLHFDKDGRQCKDQAIQSHSLQRRGPLEAIASDGHVIKIGPTLKTRPIEKRFLFERIGIRQASTFVGFCSQHDAILFSDIEKKIMPFDERTAIVLAIRSMAIELRQKHLMTKIYMELIKYFGADGDPTDILRCKLIKRGAETAIEQNTTKLKKLFRDHYKRRSENLKYLLLEFDGHMPFAATGCFEPAWNLMDEFLFIGEPMKTKWNSLSLFCGNVGDSFYGFISGYQKYKSHRIDRFLSSIDTTSADLTSILFTISVANLENCYVSDSWLKTLNSHDVDNILEMATSGILDGVGSSQPLSIRVDVPQAKLIKCITN